MSTELEVTEGQLLSEGFGMGGTVAPAETPDPHRTIETVKLEIKTLQHQAQGILLSYAIEIGRRLEEAKAMLPHGEWGPWLRRELDYSQSTAQNFMRVFHEYGDSQQSLFGGVAKSQTFGNLTYSKALRLLAIPDEEERERFAEEHDVEHMSVRELDEAIKARDAAEEKAEAAREEARKIQQEADRLQAELADRELAYEAKLTSVGVEADQARSAAEAAREALDQQRNKSERLQDALSEANAAVQAAAEERERLARELEDLRSRSVDAKTDPKVLKAVRQATINEMTEKMKAANELMYTAQHERDAANEALAAARKELEELKARRPEVRELTEKEKRALTAEAVERARAEDARRLKDLEKQLAVSDKDSAAFKALFETWQRTGSHMLGTLRKISNTDVEKAARLKEAVRAVTEKINELIETGF